MDAIEIKRIVGKSFITQDDLTDIFRGNSKGIMRFIRNNKKDMVLSKLNVMKYQALLNTPTFAEFCRVEAYRMYNEDIIFVFKHRVIMRITKLKDEIAKYGAFEPNRTDPVYLSSNIEHCTKLCLFHCVNTGKVRKTIMFN